MQLRLELCTVLTSLPLKNGTGELGKVQRKATITGVKQLLCGKWLTRQGIYRPEEEITRGDKKKNLNSHQRMTERAETCLFLSKKCLQVNCRAMGSKQIKRDISLHKAYLNCVTPFHGMQWILSCDVNSESD